MKHAKLTEHVCRNALTELCSANAPKTNQHYVIREVCCKIVLSVVALQDRLVKVTAHAADNAGVGAGSEEVTSVEDSIEAVEDQEPVVVIETELIIESELSQESTEEPTVNFWKGLFCKVFYSFNYEACISQ